MRTRLEGEGIEVSDYAPRLDQYIQANDSGGLLYYVVRCDGEPIGHATIYLTNDMHNGDLIAYEDTIYITPAHRNGTGKTLVKTILADLRTRGAKRAYVTPVTDLRVGKIWKRMGFKPVAEVLTYNF